jgi:hypothetical protein
MNKTALRPPKEGLCFFCERPADGETPETGSLQTASRPLPLAGKSHAFLYHSTCVAYANSMRLQALVARDTPEGDADRPPCDALFGAWRTSRSAVCRRCCAPGASVPCKAGVECGFTYHLPCAREAALEGEVVFATAARACACSKHVSK